MHATDLILSERSATPRLDNFAPTPPAAPLERPDPFWLPRRFGRDLTTALPLVAADLISVVLALVIARQLAAMLWPHASFDMPGLWAAFLAGICLAHLSVGFYPGAGLTLLAEIRLAGVAALLITPIFLAVPLSQDPLSLRLPLVITVTCLLGLVMTPLARAAIRAMAGHFAWWQQPVLVVGDGDAARAVYSYLRGQARLGLRPVGIVSLGEANGAEGHGAVSHDGASLTGRAPGWTIIAMPKRSRSEVHRAARALGRGPLPRVIVSHVDASSSLWRRAARCLDWPGRGPQRSRSRAAEMLKRALDLVLTVVGGLLVLPLVLVIAAIVRTESPGPAFYRQERVGRHGRRFLVWKFRTMVCDGDRVLRDYLNSHPDEFDSWNRDHKLQNDPRVTHIGRLLRKTSLDELPQLWNVLRGEMSLVGPRPILASEIPNFGSSFDAFCSVPPGITGLWQVSGRNRTTYAEHVELDAYYARNWSLWLDLLILALTFKVVLSREGAY